MKRLITAAVLAVGSTVFAGPVWLEAEHATAGNFPPAAENPFAPQGMVEGSLVSGGAWVGVQGKREGATWLEFRVRVDRAGEYALWARKFWRHGPFRWRVDGRAWTQAPSSLPLIDSVGMRKFVALSWVRAGTVRLEAGEHTLRVEVPPGQGAAAFDCFALSDAPFFPNGALKPGERYDRAPDGWFAWEPGPDPLKESPIDLSRLNHLPAGKFGWAKRQGGDVVFEREGRPTAFWGVTVGDNEFMAHDEAIDHLAGKLARSGVNLVRLHIDFEETAPGPRLERVQYFVAALKKRGIYAYLGWHCTAVARVKPEWGLEGIAPGTGVQALLIAYEPMQKLYQRWTSVLLKTPNPYADGVPLGRDPAVMGLELIDEDNLTFWTFQPYAVIPAPVTERLERAFAQFVVGRYGSLEKALAKWGPDKPPAKGTDDPASGRLALYPAGQLTGFAWAREQRNPARAADQARFLTEFQSLFWADMGDWVRKESGFGGLVIGTNWKSADDRVLGPLDKYALRAGDATAENNYFGGDFASPPKAFPFTEGDAFRSVSTLLDPVNPVLMMPQFDDRPHFWTEGNWQTPNRFRTEMPLLLASYFSLQGVDGFALFTCELGPGHSMVKWPVMSPSVAGQFPAAALIYRAGLVSQAPVVQREALPLERLFALEGAAFAKPLGLDDTQAGHVPAAGAEPAARSPRAPGAGGETGATDTPGATAASEVDPLAYFVGRAVRVVGVEPGESFVDPRLATLIDRAGKTVTSVTGELMLDWGRGVLRIDAPGAQGAVGFLRAAGDVATGDAVFALDNEYAAVVLVALDDRPLASSNRMLLQVMTEETNFGWRTTPTTRAVRGRVEAFERIEAVGHPPLAVREVSGRVRLNRPDAGELRVTPLDLNGYPKTQASELKAGDLPLDPRTMYYVIEK